LIIGWHARAPMASQRGFERLWRPEQSGRQRGDYARSRLQWYLSGP
jgi:hypothetical protein